MPVIITMQLVLNNMVSVIYYNQHCLLKAFLFSIYNLINHITMVHECHGVYYIWILTDTWHETNCTLLWFQLYSKLPYKMLTLTVLDRVGVSGKCIWWIKRHLKDLCHIFWVQKRQQQHSTLLKYKKNLVLSHILINCYMGKRGNNNNTLLKIKKTI